MSKRSAIGGDSPAKRTRAAPPQLIDKVEEAEKSLKTLQRMAQGVLEFVCATDRMRAQCVRQVDAIYMTERPDITKSTWDSNDDLMMEELNFVVWDQIAMLRVACEANLANMKVIKEA